MWAPSTASSFLLKDIADADRPTLVILTPTLQAIPRAKRGWRHDANPWDRIRVTLRIRFRLSLKGRIPDPGGAFNSGQDQYWYYRGAWGKVSPVWGRCGNPKEELEGLCMYVAG
eukprot:760564-Amorphochlora_amoeboformis.AAC.1